MVEYVSLESPSLEVRVDCLKITHLTDDQLKVLWYLLLPLIVLLILGLLAEQMLVDLEVGQDGVLRLEDLHDGCL